MYLIKIKKFYIPSQKKSSTKATTTLDPTREMGDLCYLDLLELDMSGEV